MTHFFWSPWFFCHSLTKISRNVLFFFLGASQSFRYFSLFLITSLYFFFSALTSLLRGEEDDEGNDDDEEQGDDGNEADLQGGPAGLLRRFRGVGLRHSRVSSFCCRLYQLTWGETAGEGLRRLVDWSIGDNSDHQLSMIYWANMPNFYCPCSFLIMGMC